MILGAGMSPRRSSSLYLLGEMPTKAATSASANPSGGNYNEQAANEAWATTLAFLERHLKLSTPTRAQ